MQCLCLFFLSWCCLGCAASPVCGPQHSAAALGVSSPVEQSRNKATKQGQRSSCVQAGLALAVSVGETEEKKAKRGAGVGSHGH